MNEWVDAVEEKGFDQMLGAYMRNVGESSNPVAFSKLLKLSSSTLLLPPQSNGEVGFNV